QTCSETWALRGTYRWTAAFDPFENDRLVPFAVFPTQRDTAALSGECSIFGRIRAKLVDDKRQRQNRGGHDLDLLALNAYAFGCRIVLLDGPNDLPDNGRHHAQHVLHAMMDFVRQDFLNSFRYVARGRVQSRLLEHFPEIEILGFQGIFLHA